MMLNAISVLCILGVNMKSVFSLKLYNKVFATPSFMVTNLRDSKQYTEPSAAVNDSTIGRIDDSKATRWMLQLEHLSETPG